MNLWISYFVINDDLKESPAPLLLKRETANLWDFRKRTFFPVFNLGRTWWPARE